MAVLRLRGRWELVMASRVRGGGVSVVRVKGGSFALVRVREDILPSQVLCMVQLRLARCQMCQYD